jgi:hypothetical protein
MKKCKTPDTMYNFKVSGNTLTYQVILPEDKVITRTISEQLEDELHDLCEKRLAYWKPRRIDTALNYIADNYEEFIFVFAFLIPQISCLLLLFNFMSITYSPSYFILGLLVYWIVIFNLANFSYSWKKRFDNSVQ